MKEEKSRTPTSPTVVFTGVHKLEQPFVQTQRGKQQNNAKPEDLTNSKCMQFSHKTYNHLKLGPFTNILPALIKFNKPNSR